MSTPKGPHLITKIALVLLSLSLAYKFNILPELLGSYIGVRISTSKPVDRFFENLKKAAMRASLNLP